MDQRAEPRFHDTGHGTDGIRGGMSLRERLQRCRRLAGGHYTGDSSLKTLSTRKGDCVPKQSRVATPSNYFSTLVIRGLSFTLKEGKFLSVKSESGFQFLSNTLPFHSIRGGGSVGGGSGSSSFSDDGLSRRVQCTFIKRNLPTFATRTLGIIDIFSRNRSVGCFPLGDDNI